MHLQPLLFNETQEPLFLTGFIENQPYKLKDSGAHTPPQNMLPWYIAYFELKAFEK